MTIVQDYVYDNLDPYSPTDFWVTNSTCLLESACEGVIALLPNTTYQILISNENNASVIMSYNLTTYAPGSAGVCCL